MRREKGKGQEVERSGRESKRTRIMNMKKSRVRGELVGFCDGLHDEDGCNVKRVGSGECGVEERGEGDADGEYGR